MKYSSPCIFFFNDPATTEIYPLSLHDALPIYSGGANRVGETRRPRGEFPSHSAGRAPPDSLRSRDAHRIPASRHCASVPGRRSEEHTSELQSQSNLVCRLLLEKKIIELVLLAL